MVLRVIRVALADRVLLEALHLRHVEANARGNILRDVALVVHVAILHHGVVVIEFDTGLGACGAPAQTSCRVRVGRYHHDAAGRGVGNQFGRGIWIDSA